MHERIKDFESRSDGAMREADVLPRVTCLDLHKVSSVRVGTKLPHIYLSASLLIHLLGKDGAPLLLELKVETEVWQG